MKNISRKALLVIPGLTIALGLAGTLPLPAQAGDAGAFLGGMITSRVLGNMRDRTDAQEQMAYNSQPRTQTVYVQDSGSSGGSSTKSTEQRLNDLEALANKGYISKSEYQTRRKAIIDGV